ncbi:MAG: aminotransferase class V-fold PLP-dependent enzyme [Cytophagales bacterium]|nr:MAG: aminotransferase class V-fold PLP-dependent enzyme [Cytophagales bacterium]TAF62342.1 MAG: aminotransferase class V-fold PLP-dependent enzyme [Cytophagales bacterium]
MINFSTGPSRVHDQLGRYFADALKNDICSINHRSTEFKSIYKSIKKHLATKLKLPEGYVPILMSSATECWYVLSRDFDQMPFYHFFNGAFGQRWFEYRYAQNPSNTFKINFEVDVYPRLPAYLPPNGFIALTANETSNGTALPREVMHNIRQTYPDSIIAVDATSCMAGEVLNWENADVWFASVQKCFALPAGMAVLVVSEKVAQAVKNKPQTQYNSLSYLYNMALENQTTHTPNVLNAYFLSRVLESSPEIELIDAQITARAQSWYSFLEKIGLQAFVKDAELRSRTVVAVQDSPKRIKKIKQVALESGFLLGEGYGQLKADTFRIANFPQHTEEETYMLQDFLKELLTNKHLLSK